MAVSAAPARPLRGRDYPTTFGDFHSWFADEESCLAFLERLSCTAPSPTPIAAKENSSSRATEADDQIRNGCQEGWWAARPTEAASVFLRHRSGHFHQLGHRTRRDDRQTMVAATRLQRSLARPPVARPHARNDPAPSCGSAELHRRGSHADTPLEATLALVDVERGVARAVEGSEVEPRTSTSPGRPPASPYSSAGAERYERRTLEYRVGDERAVPVPVEVGDFYGMAAS